MTLEELKSLRQGEKVIFTKVDSEIRKYYNHEVGNEMIFLDLDEGLQVANFMRNSVTISHFSYDICNYIERKTTLIRNEKLNQLGI
jgi:hypothetical protein